MLTDYFEPFMLLEKHAAPDMAGGTWKTLREMTAFRGALTQTAGEAQLQARQAALALTPALLHDPDVTLCVGDYVRREKTGDVYRVTGNAADMRTPVFAVLQCAQVPVERVVCPC